MDRHNFKLLRYRRDRLAGASPANPTRVCLRFNMSPSAIAVPAKLAASTAAGPTFNNDALTIFTSADPSASTAVARPIPDIDAPTRAAPAGPLPHARQCRSRRGRREHAKDPAANAAPSKPTLPPAPLAAAAAAASFNLHSIDVLIKG